uniref:Putative nickel-responsive regulator n=1 Tax=candidate division WOR-3 bacterium TaxID=2052148 RepID=A0A7C4U6X1_UNCW3
MIKRKSVSVSLEEDLFTAFERYVKEKNYKTRSKAIADIIRNEIAKKEILKGNDVIGIISLIYNHHKRELTDTITDIQHHHHKLILSSLHIHLDKDNCLEVIITRGDGSEIQKLKDTIKSTKGVLHCSLNTMPGKIF